MHCTSIRLQQRNHLNTPPHLKNDQIKWVDLCEECHLCWVTVYSINWYTYKPFLSLSLFLCSAKSGQGQKALPPSGSCSLPWNTEFSSLGCLLEWVWEREMPTAETSALIIHSAWNCSATFCYHWDKHTKQCKQLSILLALFGRKAI